jgi:hypothetical protein
MKNVTLLACGSAILLVAVSASADPIRAGYELTLDKGKDHWEATTVVPVEAGQPIQQGLGPYVVSMKVKEEKGDKYTLLVSVLGEPGTSTEKSEFLRHAFPGNHKEQLEFSASEGALALKGVIFVGPPKSAANK